MKMYVCTQYKNMCTQWGLFSRIFVSFVVSLIQFAPQVSVFFFFEISISLLLDFPYLSSLSCLPVLCEFALYF